ncbi:hypothetical protein GCM10022278_10540 [Allohahella marinimesophila]|uniref:DUF2384 domain-containing protein n=1 Tax=Allohahella marinimesophila TaxID=1054972 RepID=A0ABP7NT70_9GAMM
MHQLESSQQTTVDVANEMRRLAKFWALKDAEAAGLFGVSDLAWAQIKSGAEVDDAECSDDVLERIDILSKSQRRLRDAFCGSDSRAETFLHMHSWGAPWDPAPPLKPMLETGLPGIRAFGWYVRRLTRLL